MKININIKSTRIYYIPFLSVPFPIPVPISVPVPVPIPDSGFLLFQTPDLYNNLLSDKLVKQQNRIV